MTLENVLWIALSAALAFGLAWFSYFYKSGKTPYRYLLASLRFLGILGALLLLVPLQLEKNTVTTQPHRLMLLLDNSASAGRSPSREELLSVRDFFREDTDLSQRFDLETYTFGGGVRPSDTLDFSEKRTDISAAIQTLSKAHLDGNSSLVLVTDGIQNQGKGITPSASGSTTVFPIVVGDTTAYRDIRIDGLNANRYAFLRNQYPIEILISYRGAEPVNTNIVLRDNGKQVYGSTLRMSAGRATERISVLLTAEEVGFHSLTAEVSALENERNTRNNRLTTGIEIIDETTRVRIVSNRSHPDIGALTRSIEANEQRQVSFIKPEEVPAYATETDIWIFYQPDPSFRRAYETIANSRKPLLTIAGDLANWNFLNSVQTAFRLEDSGPSEELLPVSNAAFAYFDASEWDVSGYPPLSGDLGEYLILQPNEELLGQRVRGVALNQPLMALLKGSDRREAVIFGSGIWKWRMHSFKRDANFENFDALFSKIWLFLGAGKESERLNLEYESLLDGQQAAVIRARFFDEALRFDPTARLRLDLKDSTGTVMNSFPMALARGEYQADISNLPPGTYAFDVQVLDTDYRRSGQFRMQEFDLENQQVRSDPESLMALAESSGGGLYYPSQLNDLKDSLMTSERFRPISRTQRNVVSLIDFRWLLGFVVATLGIEWFIRKYNGLL
ncbi:VWA domain-containing protein [Robiginitalea aurantiaca]|uniref:VWA domain-containing protein n=1 Tax=Robiginitalea aurantiaca TaxID=3056915 RepID=A0ABT7WFU4_9FLAO|nr:VWA domain-containing protein [Robiginitalea aurantiaca]MDM9631792.1 VWA domain-containing protein [Robiginitalea aurantiaca]